MDPLDAKELLNWDAEFESKITVESGMPYKEYTKPLEQSTEENCQCRLLCLPNSMVVTCISNTDLKSASASLTVDAGMHEDPSYALGMTELIMYILQDSMNYPNEENIEKNILNGRDTFKGAINECETWYNVHINNERLDKALGRISNGLIGSGFSAKIIEQKIDMISKMELDEEKLVTLIESMVKSKEEQLAGISSEASRMWSHICSGEYNFDQLDKEIACLRKISKRDLIKLWDSCVNLDTASQYTRADLHIWSPKAKLPSAAELENYSASVLALQRLVKDGMDYYIRLEELDDFVEAVSKNKQDNAFEELIELCAKLQMPEQESTSCINKKDAASAVDIQKIKNCLKMALERASNASDYHKYFNTDYSNIGMYQTREGVWLIEDIAKFQGAQKLNGLPMPVTKLTPKYEE
ncbi:metalloprotease [Coemansia sp. RSA 988]|nr:metalloprotease [Coemansia sp. RSA 988]